MRQRISKDELYVRYRRLVDALPQYHSVAAAAKASLLPYRQAMRILLRLGYRYELLDPKGTPVLGRGIRHEVLSIDQRPNVIAQDDD